MFHDIRFQAAGPSEVGNWRVLGLWSTCADGSYYREPNSPDLGFYEAWRFKEGRGMMYLSSGKELILEPQTLLLTHMTNRIRWFPITPVWRFWNVYFIPDGQLPLPLEQPMTLSQETNEQAEFDAMAQHIGAASMVERQLATSIFLRMLYKWAFQYMNNQATSDCKYIDSIIREMHKRLEINWTVSDMAELSGLGERRFRQVFHQVAGVSPKRYYDELRLNTAFSLLQEKGLSVSEVASRLGFNDQFHFSKVFRAHFGSPPSSFRLKKSGKS